MYGVSFLGLRLLLQPRIRTNVDYHVMHTHQPSAKKCELFEVVLYSWRPRGRQINPHTGTSRTHRNPHIFATIQPLYNYNRLVIHDNQ